MSSSMRKIMSLLLTLALCITALPLQVFAEGDTDTGEIYSYSFEELVSVVGQEKAVEMWGD